MEKIYYTGIGSRTISQYENDMLIMFGKELAMTGHILRSGKADGSDTAFQMGCQLNSGEAEIYIPWEKFHKDLDCYDHKLDIPLAKVYTKETEELLYSVSPHSRYVADGVKKLHLRNVHQLLGKDLKTPSKFVIFCSDEEDGIVHGGTAIAVNLARKMDIPTYNIRDLKTHSGDILWLLDCLLYGEYDAQKS